MRNGIAYQQEALAPLTFATESGLWPTPTVLMTGETRSIADFEAAKARALIKQNDVETKLLIFRSRHGVSDVNEKGNDGNISTETVPPGTVYFIFDGEAVKIGYSTKALKRLKSLQTSHSRMLKIIGTMPGSIRLEKQLHKKFRRLRVRNEWFRYTKEIARYIEANTLEGKAKSGVPKATEDLRHHLRRFRDNADPIMRAYLTELERQLRSWDGKGDREALRVNIKDTIREIEFLERRRIIHFQMLNRQSSIVPAIGRAEFRTTN